VGISDGQPSLYVHRARELDHVRYPMYGTLYTVRIFRIVVIVLLMSAGANEDEARQPKGKIRGSTGAWLLESTSNEAHDRRRPVLGRPTCSCHLLARSGTQGAGPERGRRPGLERLPVRDLGASKGLRQTALEPRPRISGRRALLCGHVGQRHPQGCHCALAFSIGSENRRRDLGPLGPSTREGDVQGDVARSLRPHLAQGTNWPCGEAGPVGNGLKRILGLSCEGDVQGDVACPCCSRMEHHNQRRAVPCPPGGMRPRPRGGVIR
jgi:hypothetical protein